MKIQTYLTWHEEKNKDLDFSTITDIEGFAHLQGCSRDLSALTNVGSCADLRGCSNDLPALTNVGGNLYLQGCSEELKKSLAKTLERCGNIYIEFRDKPLTLDGFKAMYSENKYVTDENGKKYQLVPVE